MRRKHLWNIIQKLKCLLLYGSYSIKFWLRDIIHKYGFISEAHSCTTRKKIATLEAKHTQKKTLLFITIFFLWLLLMYNIPQQNRKYSTQLNKSTWRLPRKSLQSINSILSLTANFSFKEQLFQNDTSYRGRWGEWRWWFVLLYWTTIAWKTYLGRSKLPLLLKSIVPFDMGGNTVQHNGVQTDKIH